MNGNFVDEAKEMTKNNWLGVVMGNGGTEDDKKNTIIDKAHSALPIPTETAEDAYISVLKYAGASFKRDTLDARIVKNVLDRTGNIIDVQGGYPAHSPFEMIRIVERL